MYKLTVTNSEDGIKRTFMRLPNGKRLFANAENYPDLDPELYKYRDSVDADETALSAIAGEAIDHGDAAQMELITI